MAYALDQIVNRLMSFRRAWEKHAPETTFREMTLGDFEDSTRESLDLRDKIERLKVQFDMLRMQRDAADRKSRACMDKIAKAVCGTPEFGDDRTLYREIGRVPKSERKTGLMRKFRKKRVKPNPDTPGASRSQHNSVLTLISHTFFIRPAKPLGFMGHGGAVAHPRSGGIRPPCPWKAYPGRIGSIHDRLMDMGERISPLRAMMKP